MAAFLKVSCCFGFPVLGTPLLSLVLDVKSAVVILIVPNIVMDGLQFIRNGAPVAVVKRFAVLLMFGAVGTVIGTRLLVAVSSRTAALILGGITNVPGTPLVIYFHALGLAKRDFLSSVSFTFVVYKIIQLGAVVYYGLLSPTLLGHSLILTGVA